MPVLENSGTMLHHAELPVPGQTPGLLWDHTQGRLRSEQSWGEHPEMGARCLASGHTRARADPTGTRGPTMQAPSAVGLLCR